MLGKEQLKHTQPVIDVTVVTVSELSHALKGFYVSAARVGGKYNIKDTDTEHQTLCSTHNEI